MTVPEYRALTQKAMLKVGPSYLKTFLIYTVISAVLLYLSLRMQERYAVWQESVYQFARAGDPNLPPLTPTVLVYLLLALVLLLLAQIIKAGWYDITLRGVRGLPFSWRDLTAGFPRIGKIFVISIVIEFGCILGLCLFILPGVILFYRWRLSWFVLAEHPEYGPIRCLKQSARLMVGEKMNLFRLDLSLWLPYALALIVFYFTRGVVLLWEFPSICLTHCVFYNTMTHWEDTSPQEEPGPER